jgi:hypothetical protein
LRKFIGLAQYKPVLLLCREVPCSPSGRAWAQPQWLLQQKVIKLLQLQQPKTASKCKTLNKNNKKIGTGFAQSQHQ